MEWEFCIIAQFLDCYKGNSVDFFEVFVFTLYDDLAVYGTRLEPIQTCKPQTSSRYTAQTKYQAPLICAHLRYPQDRIPIILGVSLPYKYSGYHHDTTGSLGIIDHIINNINTNFGE